MSLEEAMGLVGRDSLEIWKADATTRNPGDFLLESLRRLQVFDLESSEQAKTLLIDALFAEIVSDHSSLKVWKAAVLNTDRLTGVADYLIAPRRAFLATPLLCVVEAKRDDFDRGRIQCVAEMYACRWNNEQRGNNVDVFGIVSNGQGWRFYKLTTASDIYETDLLAISDMPRLLGMLDHVCRECARNAA